MPRTHPSVGGSPCHSKEGWSHVSDDGLEEYIMGRQPEEGEAQIEEHLLICQSCRDKLVEVEEAIRSIREVMRSIQVERKG